MCTLWRRSAAWASPHNLDVTEGIVLNPKHYIPNRVVLGGSKFNLVVVGECLSLMLSNRGVSQRRDHTSSHLSQSWLWPHCHSCLALLHTVSSTHTQWCWDDENSVFLPLSAALGSCFFGLCETLRPRRRAGITSDTRRWIKRLVTTGHVTPHLCSFSAQSWPSDPFCSTFWFPWSDCT